MRNQRKPHKALLITSLIIAGTSCGKKSNDSKTDSETDVAENTVSSTNVPKGAVAASEDTAVTLETSKLQLAGSLNLVASKSTTSLALNEYGEQEVTLSLGDERKLFLRVNNEAFEAIDSATSILCYVAQTKFWEQANKGVYRALIDGKKCEEGRGGGGGDSSSTSGQSSYQPVFVKAIREEGKPLIADLRFDATEGKDEVAHHARIIIVAPPSANYPAGIFKMTFSARKSDGTNTGAGGFIAVEKDVGQKFLLKIGDGGNSGREERTLRGISELEKIDGTEDYRGAIRSENDEKYTDEGGKTYSRKSSARVRFDASFVNVTGVSVESGGGGNSQAKETKLDGCYDRNKFKTAIWNYDVRNKDDKVVPLFSAFQAEYEKDGRTYFANASYYGLWVQGDVLPANGDTIHRVEWAPQGGGKTRTPYKVFRAPGKLVKLTRATKKLSELKGLDMILSNNGSNFIVQWNGTKFEITAKQVQSNNGQRSEEAASGDVKIEQWGLNLNVLALNATINIPNGSVLSDNFEVAYHSETTVSGTDDVPTGDLVCFQNCPKMAPKAADFKRSQGGSQAGPMTSALYETTTVTWDKVYTTNQAKSLTTALATYTYDATNQVLKNGAVSFVLPSDLPSSQGGDYDNVNSGALIPKATWDAITDKTIDTWRAQQTVTIYYRWMAGGSSWNQFISMKGADGKFIKFDRPIELNYTHTTANDFDGNTNSGVVDKPYRLTYAGPGQLWGIPYKYSSEVGREMPAFSLKPGTKIGDFTIYPVEGEQRMAKAETSKCSGLSLDNLPALPEKVEIPDVKFSEGDKNTVLKYVGGAATGS